MLHNGSLTCVDLFAGAGGLSEGFEQAGYRTVLATDYDEQAAQTYRYNHPGVPFLVGDIRQLSCDKVMRAADLLPGDLDILCGGPPCQGFSLAGQRLEHDPRNQLFLEYVRMAEALKPKIILFENVPGITTMQNGRVLQAILAEFEGIGYRCESRVLNAADYGVPQIRKRFIMIGVRNGAPISFPSPSHGLVDGLCLQFPEYQVEPYVTVWEALSDLPVIRQGEGAEESLHSGEYHNDYQRARRGRRNPGAIYNHRAIRHSDTIQKRYAAIPEGCNNAVLPPEIRTKKRNAFKLDREKPSFTVTCNHRTDLLHPVFPRGSTVREAARLQSFDDDYRFFGNLTRKAKWVTQDDQVGNAVPPLLARALAVHLRQTLLNEGRRTA